MTMLKRALKLILFFVTWILVFDSANLQASEPVSQWNEIETRHTIIRYQSIDTLVVFNTAILYGRGWWSVTAPFALLSEEDNRRIAAMKADAVFERVQDILDMKKKFKKVFIRLYPNSDILATVYKESYDQDSHFRAWYEYKTNTVFLNTGDCHEGLLAHELAHAIIDNFLLVKPPKNAAEILARYVDTHLK